ncbi:FAD-binding oxidoreductase [Algoriphagus vanfongensis]|uniref:FAD-binding oxidoreductase n=1 Tax=Algoriphagus vanfongensis TaxID=426371 RepID=UPI000424D92F|nr:FAD-binding oxidoreductase [Algoriphagus vanfongensis]
MNVEILKIEKLTHDVKQLKVEKPKGFTFVPGQATEVAIKKQGWEEKKRPFTFTSLPEEDYLQFVIKSYHDHDGVTDRIDRLKIGDQLILDDAWGAIQYKGKGVFIAGGAGVTPFISIFKSLKESGELAGNKLIFANKTAEDVILESWFREILGDDFLSILDKEDLEGHFHGRVDKEFLENHVDDFSQQFYVCGPEPMIKAVNQNLEELGADAEEIVFEK